MVAHETKHKTSIVGFMSSIFFFLVAGILLLYILISAFLPDMTIKIFQFRPFIVVTNSMEPTIRVNDVVVVKNPDLDQLEKGDIITFYADINYDGQKEVVTHYIDSIQVNTNGERYYRTIREGGTTHDTWILSDADILGTYAFKIPQLGVAIQFVQSPYGIAVIVVNILIVVIIVHVIKTGKSKKD